jgi:hypothetical protein
MLSVTVTGNNVLCVATVYGPKGLGIEFRGGGGARFFPPVQTDSGAHPASCKMSTWVSFPGVKRPGRGVNHPPNLAPG